MTDRLPNTTSEILLAMGVDLERIRTESGSVEAFEAQVRAMPEAVAANKALMAIHLRREARGVPTDKMVFEFFSPEHEEDEAYVAARNAAYLTQRWRGEQPI